MATKSVVEHSLLPTNAGLRSERVRRVHSQMAQIHACCGQGYIGHLVR